MGAEGSVMELVPPNADAGQTDRRAGKRYTLILRAAKLICEAGEFLCVLRDVSDKGLKARLFHAMPTCDAYEIEFGSGERFAVEPVWNRGRDTGFRFAAGPIDVQGLLAEAGPFPKRSIRLRIAEELPVRLRFDNGELTGRVVDISQHGAQIELPAALPIGQWLRIEARGLPVLHGRVRWRRAARHGVVFQEGFRLDELAQLTADMQIGSAKPPAPALSDAKAGRH